MRLSMTAEWCSVLKKSPPLTDTLSPILHLFFMKRIHLPCPSGSTTRNVSENEVIFYETDTLCVFCIRFVNSRRKIGYNVSIFKGEIHDPEQTIYSGSSTTCDENVAAPCSRHARGAFSILRRPHFHGMKAPDCGIV